MTASLDNILREIAETPATWKLLAVSPAQWAAMMNDLDNPAIRTFPTNDKQRRLMDARVVVVERQRTPRLLFTDPHDARAYLDSRGEHAVILP